MQGAQKRKNKEKAYTILNTKGERSDEDRRGINEKRSKVVVSRHSFFTRARESEGITFFPALPGGVALPSEDDLTCCVQENINTEKKPR